MHSDLWQKDYSWTWNALPLSLQCHIYVVLRQQYSPESLSKLLGLTTGESRQIQKEMRFRSLHPASLTEIWDYATRTSDDIPGLPSCDSIDVSSLNEFMDYMVYASNHAFANESEIRAARSFLALRGISADLLGTWLPDPSQPDGSEWFVHVPGVVGRNPLPSIDIHDDSGYSSLSEGDRDVNFEQGCSGLANGQPQLEPTMENGIHEQSIAQARGFESIDAPRQNQTGKMRKRGPPATLLPPKAGRHPLSIVTKPDESPMQAEHDVESMDLDLHYGRDASMAQACAFDPEPTLLPVQEDMRVDTHGAVDNTEVWLHRNPKETLDKVNAGEHAGSTKQDGKTRSTEAEESSRRAARPARPQQGHLVLRIQNKDGLAKIMKKTTKLTDSYNTACTADPELPAYPCDYEKQPPTKAIPSHSLPLNTKMSAFSRALIESALLASQDAVNSNKSDRLLPFRALSTPTKPVTLPSFSTKRKASRSDLRPTPSKLQHIMAGSQPCTPLKGIVPEPASTKKLLSSLVRQTWEPSSKESSEASTPTKLYHDASRSTTAQSAAAFSSSASPRSPSYSPISENENLEEHQALIRGPKVSDQGMNVPVSNIEVGSHQASSSTPTHGHNLDFQQRVTLNSPTPSGSVHHTVQNPVTPVSFHEAKSSSKASTPSSPKEIGSLIPEPTPKIKLVIKPPRSTLDTRENAESTETNPTPKSIMQTHSPMHEVKGNCSTEGLPKVDRIVGAKPTTASRARPKKATPGPDAQPKPLGKKKRGPRGPYRKTRERLAKEEQEREGASQHGQERQPAEQGAEQQKQAAQAEPAPQQAPIARKKKAPMC